MTGLVIRIVCGVCGRVGVGGCAVFFPGYSALKKIDSRFWKAI